MSVTDEEFDEALAQVGPSPMLSSLLTRARTELNARARADVALRQLIDVIYDYYARYGKPPIASTITLCDVVRAMLDQVGQRTMLIRLSPKERP
jgi:hypothetical protein